MWPRSHTSGLRIGAIWRSRSAVGRWATSASVRSRTPVRSSAKLLAVVATCLRSPAIRGRYTPRCAGLRSRREARVQHPQRVAAADRFAHLRPVAVGQRGLQRAHAAHVLEARERRLDEAVEVGADRGMVVGSGDLADAVDVAADEGDRARETVAALLAEPVADVVPAVDDAEHA